MMKSEITEVKDDDGEIVWLTRAQMEKIRRIIEHQKYLCWSSSSSSSQLSSSASCSYFFSCQKSSSLLQLMKGGSTWLRRLFDMEHTSLSIYFDKYSGSPEIKPIPLWGSDTADEQVYDPWASIKQIGRPSCDLGNVGLSNFASDGSFRNEEFGSKHKKGKINHRKLKRKKQFRRLPGFGFWRFRGFRFRVRLRKLRN
ncbi:ATP-dependent Clp protease proteolytic subunit like [Melia azedarach]|uniref:ATP-dependent Clp protease proteolytic subunit like n=1 Tax=Melia azedarach TaxID=155640 RepID=A0ACC1WZX5_MELAZ|nr:ATP-dependent Clp protease proteolytic subunit like [Melia azedarach]